jgi:hypothetical protein
MTVEPDRCRLLSFQVRAAKPRRWELAGSFALPAFAADATRLMQDNSQRQARIGAAMTLPATHRVLQQQQALNILNAKT